MADINSKRRSLKAGEADSAQQSRDRNQGAHEAPISRRAGEGVAPDQPANAQLMTPEAAGQSASLVEFVELLFFAYRDFTGDADELLSDLGYGRAHHRVIHFVARHPGLRVADLLDILRITKQSLARVLKQLIDEGFVSQKSGDTDRRERHLYLTQKGRNFAEQLTTHQCARVAKALNHVGPAGNDHIEAFLVAMISEPDQAAVAELFESAAKNDKKLQRGVGHVRKDIGENS